MSTHALALPDREAWLSARREGIGGSDAAAVVGASPWRSALAVYMDKIGQGEPIEETEAMRMGLLLEPIVARLYQEETGRTVLDPGPFVIRRSPRHGFMTATLDREVIDATRGPGVLQIKTASAYAEDQWAGGEAPLPYEVQLQHEMEVAGVAWGSIAVLIGGQRFLWLDRERNDALVAGLVAREAAFWDCVQRRVPPPAGESKADRALLARLYPQDSGEVVALPPTMVEWDALRLEAIAALKKWDGIKDAAENRIKDALRDASVGVLPNGDRYTWTTSERAGYTVAATTVRTLRRRNR